ncbi:acyltransferase [Actinoallomurus spadix]|nr:acyltransferase [Actinoallomurus spadix]MCO5989658.1 acyltransferase [Actinoallomurus spadix]
MTRVAPTNDARPTGDASRAIGRRPHLPALDGLRGVAIIGVLLFHTGHLSGGFLGVDLFFALSGHLITGLLLREVEATGTVSPVAFWGRRIRRLLPALAAMLAGVTVLVRAVGPPDLVRTTRADGPWVQLNLVNWHLLAESASYWDRFGAARVFEHLWSIAVEEQFYLVWPVLLLLTARGGGRAGHRVAVTAAVGSAVSLVLMVALADPADPTRVYTGTDTRAFSLLLGAMVATPPLRAVLARVAGRGAGAASVSLAAGLGVAWWLVDGVDSPALFTGGLFVHSLASALLVGLCAQAPRTPVARVLARPPLRWLGLISYGLYLWHWPVFVLLSPQRTGLGGWTRTALVCAVSIGLAALSKYLVEDPIRFRAGWARGRSGAVAFAAVMAGLAVLWWALPVPAPPTVDLTNLR